MNHGYSVGLRTGVQQRATKHEWLAFKRWYLVVLSATALCASRGAKTEELERLDQLGDYRNV